MVQCKFNNLYEKSEVDSDGVKFKLDPFYPPDARVLLILLMASAAQISQGVSWKPALVETPPPTPRNNICDKIIHFLRL